MSRFLCSSIVDEGIQVRVYGCVWVLRLAVGLVVGFAPGMIANFGPPRMASGHAWQLPSFCRGEGMRVGGGMRK